MLLLNVSDIHFRHPICTSGMDPDRPFRTRLIQDARQRSAELGSVDAMLVSGDIAFAGMTEEYDEAYRWLVELATVCNCPLERIYVIPGNHDVNRVTTRTDMGVRNVHRAISRATAHEREGELLAQFRHQDTGRALMEPIAAYNVFAARFSCQVYTPDKLFWHQDLPLDDKRKLRIYGLTSTLLSGSGGTDDARMGLYLSPLQTVLDPVDGVVNLVMCHHPPDWLMDHDEVEDAVNGRAAIQFFGHKHRTRIHREQHYIRFSAGAVNPERHLPGWEPGYNFVRLNVANENGRSTLEIEAYLLVWQTNPDLFHPKLNENGEPVFRHSIRLPILPAGFQPAVEQIDLPPDAQLVADRPVVAEREKSMSDHDTRNLVLRFWDLTSSKRREIALELGLLDRDEITQLPEPERYGRALARAGERGLLERVAEEIRKREGR